MTIGHHDQVHDHASVGGHSHDHPDTTGKGRADAAPSTNPFVVYRRRLGSYQRWIAAGFTDEEFVRVVEHLDAAVDRVDGTGFHRTALNEQPKLARMVGLPDGARLWVKDETHHVAGSHKARHLFGLLLHHAVDERLGAHHHGDLAIASCGNAAIAAATIASAAGRRIQVFIPTWASDAIAARLERLGAEVVRCERRDGELGDPAYLRFLEAVDGGAEPFSVQGTVAPHVVEGGRTIAWDIVDQLAELSGEPATIDVVAAQVGGGAFGSALVQGFEVATEAGELAAMPRTFAVQTEAAAPLRRAWELLLERDDPDVALAAASDDRAADQFMTPWDDVGDSLASGILDDVTYDWTSLAHSMLRHGGEPLVVDEDTVEMAHAAGRTTGIDVCGTGTAGLAGLMHEAVDVRPGDQVVVVFTGHRRD